MLEDLGSGKTDWRGKVLTFRDLPTLKTFVKGLMHKVNNTGDPADGMEEADP